MSELYTSRYSNRGLADAEATKVGITRGAPRFPLKYGLAGNIIELAPPSSIFRLTDKMAFKRRYLGYLDSLGAEKVKSLLSRYEESGKDIILLCYEDVTSPDESKNWCHRTMLAEWLESNLGVVVKEYPDNGTYGAKHKVEDETEELDQLSLFD